MPEAQPFLLHEDLKAPHGAVVAVQHEHGEGGELGRAVPAVAAVHHHGRLPRLHPIRDAQRPRQDQLQRVEMVTSEREALARFRGPSQKGPRTGGRRQTC